MGKIFDIIDRKLIVDDGRDRYNQVRKQFIKYADESKVKFEQAYTEKYNCIEAVSNHALEQGLQIIGEVVDKAIDFLIKEKIYDVDRNTFFDKYQSRYYKWHEVFDTINDKYLQIIMDSDQMDKYRTSRRQSRGRWQGGGFGLDGAIKGAATATALNAVGGLTHGAVNLVGKGITAVGNSMKKGNLFNDKNTLVTLADGVWQECINVHLGICDVLEDYNINKLAYITVSNSNNADSLFNNLSNKMLSSDDRKDLIIKILNLNPYGNKCYKYLVDTYGDEKNQIQLIADYFGVDIQGYKNILIQQKLDSLPVEKEQEAIEAKQKLQEYARWLGIKENNEYLRKMDSILKEHDRVARTVWEVEFETREIAVLAQEEKEKMDKIVESILSETEEELKNVVQHIETGGFKTKIKGKYLKILHKRIKEVIKKEDEKTLRTIIDSTGADDEESYDRLINIIKDTEVRSLDVQKKVIAELHTRKQNAIQQNEKDKQLATKYQMYLNDGKPFLSTDVKIKILQIVAIIYTCGLFILYMIYSRKKQQTAWNRLTDNGQVPLEM